MAVDPVFSKSGKWMIMLMVGEDDAGGGGVQSVTF
jgi:hypothetical protein